MFVSALPLLWATAASEADSEQPPNIILMVIDDATVEDVTYMPNVRSLLQQQGTTFARNYSAFPQCCPARATILTGLYPHNHRVLDNVAPQGGLPAFDNQFTVATYLDGVYQTGLIGKYLNGGDPATDTVIPPGWDDWRAATHGSTYRYLKQVQNINGVMTRFKGYMPTLYGRAALSRLESTPTDQPVFEYVAWVAPHTGKPNDPEYPGVPYVPRPLRGSYTGPNLPQDASFNEPDVADKPAAVQRRSLLSRQEIRTLKQNLVHRRESLLAVDAQVRRIVAQVTSRGQLDNTYFIFTSDNGFMQGQHRIPGGKLRAYEPSTRVPLIIRGPGFPAGDTYRGATGLQDIAPTIVDVADQPIPSSAPAPDGVSLLRLVDGSLSTDRPQLIEIANTSGLTDEQVARGVEPSEPPEKGWYARGVVTNDRWKYVEYPGSGEAEMYDLRTDPFELENLADREQYADRQTRLEEVLADYEHCAGRTCR